MRRRTALAGVVAASLLAAACARGAPELPPDRGSVNARPMTLSEFSAKDQALDCQAIDEQLRVLTVIARANSAEIANNRQGNQVAGYFAGFFLLPAIALEGNSEEKEELDRIQKRWDTLVSLKRVKGCRTKILQ